jgi:hypothetical protein
VPVAVCVVGLCVFQGLRCTHTHGMTLVGPAEVSMNVSVVDAICGWSVYWHQPSASTSCVLVASSLAALAACLAAHQESLSHALVCAGVGRKVLVRAFQAPSCVTVPVDVEAQWPLVHGGRIAEREPPPAPRKLCYSSQGCREYMSVWGCAPCNGDHQDVVTTHSRCSNRTSLNPCFHTALMCSPSQDER